METKRLGFLFGILAGVFLFIAALVAIVGGLVNVALGRSMVTFLVGATVRFILDIVVGLLMVFFAALGSRHSREFALAGGLVLILLAFVTWFLIGTEIFELLGGLFALIAGVLILVNYR